MLKPDKWQAAFDNEGRAVSFQKVLKLIIFGGVDPSIRSEVWEFLLGCYALGSTADYRRQLRTARRERYSDLLKQCQRMHSSIGTGSLAYPVGSKVMDMRSSSKDERKRNSNVDHRQASINDTEKREEYSDMSLANHRKSNSDIADIISVRGNADTAAYNSCFLPTSGPCGRYPPKIRRDCNVLDFSTGSDFNFPPLPLTDLFENDEDEKEFDAHGGDYSAKYKLILEDDNMHSFQINNNAELIMESNVRPSPSKIFSHLYNSEIESVHPHAYESVLRSDIVSQKAETVNRLRISDIPKTPLVNGTRSQEGAAHDERVSEWLWTLHRIVVDVVRTDSHLQFYEDNRNVARMFDVLAVYAWIDPATGYCQGMSDLLSPFVVIFEDNADAFWCFEMLIRRMRENFQTEGPTGVMKQLEALWHILELTDREFFTHLSKIGAESLHFAFPMLLVLFRRELSFNDALCMWEMMWAADFDESIICNLEKICLKELTIQFPGDSGQDDGEENPENGSDNVMVGLQLKHSLFENEGIKAASTYNFCGLTRNFWSRNDCLQIFGVVSPTRKGDNDLPVFVVAAILIMNRQKLIKETRSIDDMIKIFNDKLLKIHVRRCVLAAIKLRKKYLYKLKNIKGHSRRYSQ
ncbi:Ypt/Rab-GAP domain of gyp1p superfamily protein isoform 2 [Hibiscus syriacus]|uniref:Ypt/Rab-GAP domain of gyp1p superfamily protein isoform 2 n=1 Tax=Hibiscus syriacus TaxID=106335 RepID=A0A6A2ZVV7_HIBSY|nr:Ypt/Rab-GAP domain of gyp1p superfamily protein isoform 2 [Hibiscus syriacus]